MSHTEKEKKNGIASPWPFLLGEIDGAGWNAVSCSLLLLDASGFINGSNNLSGFASFLQVCDMYLKYNLPLLIMPPAGVFYPALLSMDSVNLNQLCYIMYRYYKWCGLYGLLFFSLNLLEMKLLWCKIWNLSFLTMQGKGQRSSCAQLSW